MIVTFCGHRDVANPADTKEKLRVIILDLIENGADTFYLGGYGLFDKLAAQVVYELKNEFSIKSVLVIPYLDKEYDTEYYDETLYPSLENTPLRFAISKRNEWMVKESDVVVSYVIHSWGGAAKTLEIAEKLQKKIISVV